VANTLKIPTGHILFLDDNALNVEAAEEAGFAARCVRGVQEATDALLSNGIVI
jgi:FMN phosphatase YigB (HAD superfamily)